MKIKLLENKYPIQTLLIKELFENLEQEQALTWLFEAMSYYQTQLVTPNHWHLYHTSLFELYVDFKGNEVRITAILACHPEDEVMKVEEFMSILKEAARKENLPHHFYCSNNECDFIHPMDKKRKTRGINHS